jgi:FkbM family methyltransferase
MTADRHAETARRQIRQLRIEQDLARLQELGVDLSHWRVQTLRSGWLGGEFDHMDGFVAPDTAAVDLGANVGQYALRLAAACKSVLVVEPHPRHVGLTDDLPGNCRFAPCAAGDADGQAQLNVPLVDGDEGHGLASLTDLAEVGYHRTRPYPVAVRRLDDLVTEHLPGERIGFMKVDVEGFELPALAGAAGILRDHRPTLQVEIWPQQMPHVADAIEAMGYRGLFFFDHVAWDLSRFDPAIHTAPENDWDPHHPGRFRPELHVNNFFFLPRRAT